MTTSSTSVPLDRGLDHGQQKPAASRAVDFSSSLFLIAFSRAWGVGLIPHHMWCALNSEGVVHPTDERIRASAAELSFQFEFTDVAVEFFSFSLNVAGRADLPWS